MFYSFRGIFLFFCNFSLSIKYIKFYIYNHYVYRTIKDFDYDYFFLLSLKRAFSLIITFFNKQIIFFCVDFVDYKYKHRLFYFLGFFSFFFFFFFLNFFFYFFFFFFIVFFHFLFDNLFFLSLFVLVVYYNLFLL